MSIYIHKTMSSSDSKQFKSSGLCIGDTGYAPRKQCLSYFRGAFEGSTSRFHRTFHDDVVSLCFHILLCNLLAVITHGKLNGFEKTLHPIKKKKKNQSLLNPHLLTPALAEAQWFAPPSGGARSRAASQLRCPSPQSV